MMNHEMLIDFGLSDFQTTSNLKDLGWISRSVARCWLWISQHWHSHQIRHRYHRWCPLVITHGNFGNGKHNYFSMIYLFQSYFKMMIYQYLVRHPHHPLFIQQTSSTLHPQSIGRRGTWSDLRQARYFKSGRTLSMHTVGLLFWIVLNPWGPFWEGRPVRLGEYWTVCGEEMAEVKAEHCWTRSSPAGTDWRVGNRVRLKTGQPKS